MKLHDYDKTTTIVGFVFVSIASLLIIFSFIPIVPAGTVGVFDLFGRVSDVERKLGLNVVNPFAKLVILNTKTEEIKEIMVVLSQELQQMRFVLDKEKKEAERRIIEAGGIAKAQEIINATLTPAYLQHEAI